MSMRSAALADDFARVAMCAQNSTPLSIRSLHLCRLPLSFEMANFVRKLERGHRADLDSLPPLKRGRAMPGCVSRNDPPTRVRETRSDPQ